MKLDLGCGETVRPGHIGVDRKLGGEVFPLRLPTGELIASDSVESVTASHILEHFSFTLTERVLAEWVRVLKPGGTLRIAIPDYNWIRLHPENPLSRLYLFGGHVNQDDIHYAAFTEGELRTLMNDAGLVDIQPWKSDANDCSASECSLNLQGTKSVLSEPKPRLKFPPIIAVLSRGRYGPLSVHSNIHEVLASLKIPLGESEGVYWGQCLTRLAERAIAKSAGWILFLDFDSIFTRKDVADLMRLMHDHPEADAIAPLQMKRSCDEILVDIQGKDRFPADVEGPLVQVDAAHFGLTMIRASALLKMAHPWFVATPNEVNRWDEGRLDEDIWFWKRFKQAGNKLFIAHRVAIGHAQLMGTWVGENGQPIHDYIGNFQDRGKPPGVRT